jgi:hypothetical protein
MLKFFWNVGTIFLKNIGIPFWKKVDSIFNEKYQKLLVQHFKNIDSENIGQHLKLLHWTSINWVFKWVLVGWKLNFYIFFFNFPKIYVTFQILQNYTVTPYDTTVGPKRHITWRLWVPASGTVVPATVLSNGGKGHFIFTKM